MNELKALKDRLQEVGFICELSDQDQKTIEYLGRFWCSIMGVEYPEEFINEKAWCARDLIRDIENLFEGATSYNEEEE